MPELKWALAAWSSVLSPPATDEIGAMDCDIESRQGGSSNIFAEKISVFLLKLLLVVTKI
jgi:hypothetical protein